MLNRGAKALALISLVASLSVHARTERDVNSAVQRGQWREAIAASYEILQRQPRSVLARLQGAYSLFQLGYVNAGLLWLRNLQAEDWQKIPQGLDRMVEIISLFQKKVPLELLPGRLERMDPSRVAPMLREEIRFAKGRDLVEKGNLAQARVFLSAVPKSSRFYGQARYLLAVAAIKAGSYQTAVEEFSRVFEPTVLEQTSEFWRDIKSQVSSHWGSSFEVLIDTDLLGSGQTVSELAAMGIARIAYARKDYEGALRRYGSLSSGSRYFARASLEKIWTLLALNRHQDAQTAAEALSVREDSFESIEGRPVRALILADAGDTEEARKELGQFIRIYERSREGLQRFQKYRAADALPQFLKTDIAQDQRLRVLDQYERSLSSEIESLQKEDRALFGFYQQIAAELAPLLQDTEKEISRLTLEYVKRRLVDLDRLFLQSRLILAETYLEERERLRQVYREKGEVSESTGREQEQTLMALLVKAIDEVEEATKQTKLRQPNLEFRQSELLWELATAKLLLAEGKSKKQDEAESLELKRKSLKLAEGIVTKNPSFAKHAQAMFFTGFAQIELGKIKEGGGVLLEYVKRYPRHDHSPDAFRILADLEFERDNFETAQAYYKKSLEFSESAIAGYALYKTAWCAYNLKDFAKSLVSFEKAVAWAKRASEGGQLLSLAPEARRDLISVYAEVGDHRKATQYFRLVAPNETQSYTSDYAQALDDSGLFEKSFDIYKILISSAPTAPENVRYQTAIIHGLYKLRKWNDVLREAQELSERHRSSLENPQDEESIAARAEKTLREASMVQHLEAKKAGLVTEPERLIGVDQAYLLAFSKWEKSQEVRYELSHFLLDQKKFFEAASSFKTHWLSYREQLKEPLREEALRNLIHAIEKAEETRKLGAANLSPEVNDIVTFTHEYEESYPRTKHTRAMAYLRSALYFKYEKLDLGTRESQSIFDTSPNDEFGKKSFKNLKVAYYKEKNWPLVQQWAKRVSLQEGTNAYRPELNAIRGEAMFLEAEGETEDPGKAAAILLKIADDTSLGELRERSLYNAFVRLEKAGKKAQALEVSARLDKALRRFEGMSQANGLRAALYQEAGDYEKALPLLKKFVAEPGKGVSAESIAQAKKNVVVISEALALPPAPARAPASVPPSDWGKLSQARVDFERAPLPPGGDLASRIRGGGQRLEALAKSFLGLSKKTSVHFAMEGLCSLPFLYSSYARGIAAAGDSQTEEVKGELRKIAEPLVEKSRELAAECLTKSADAEHDGPIYRRVSDTWGWSKEVSLKQKAQRLLVRLERGFPWLEPSPIEATDKELLDRHTKGEGSPDTWYALGRARWTAGRPGVARLTFGDALTREPRSGRLLNALACLEYLKKPEAGIGVLFERAGKEGSGPAWANLAYYHLKGGRLELAQASLARALDAGALDGDSEARELAKEVLEK